MFIHASDLAACVGLNPYHGSDEALLKYMKRLDHDAYKHELRSRDLADPEELVAGALSKLPKDAAQAVACLSSAPADGGSDDHVSMHQRLEKGIGAVLEQPGLSVDERAALVDHCRGSAYTSFGTRQEAGTGAKIDRDAVLGDDVRVQMSDGRYSKRYAFSLGSMHVYIGGRVDACTSDGRIVEIKNRVGRIFGALREYERVQVAAYGWIHSGRDGVLVERFGDQVLSHEVPWDPAYWDTTIVPRLKEFTQRLAESLDHSSGSTLRLLRGASCAAAADSATTSGGDASVK